VVRFTSESALHGSAVVLEAKRDNSYTIARALDEMEVARANREAGAGVFIMAASHALEGFPRLARYGQDLLVAPEGPSFPPSVSVLIVVSRCGPQRTERLPSKCSQMVTVHPAKLFRKRVLCSCR
jgi:hypothetical protein